MSEESRVAVALVIFVLFFHTASVGPGHGSITGTVADETGGILPGVTVNVTLAGAQAVPETVTDVTGAYRFDNVPAGRRSSRSA